MNTPKTSAAVRVRVTAMGRRAFQIKAVRLTAACLWLAVSTFTGVIVGGMLVLAVAQSQGTFSGVSGIVARLAIADLAILTLIALDGAPAAWWRYHTRAARSGS